MANIRFPKNRPHRAIGIVLILGFCLQLVIISQDFATLVTKIVADDMFYYLAIARNVATGNGPSFDGVVLTNGFHPLLLLAEVPIFWLLPESLHSSGVPVRIVLLFFSIINCLIAYFLYRCLLDISNRQGALLGAAVWLFQPHLAATTLSGVEAPLAAFFITVATFWSGPGTAGDKLTTRHGLVTGLLAGSVVLARTDCFIFSLVFLVLYSSHFYRHNHGKSFIRPLLLSGSAGLVVITPWLLWNYLTFGRISQDSGRALSFLYHSFDHPRGIADYITISGQRSREIADFVLGMWTGSVPLSLLVWVIILVYALKSLRTTGRSNLSRLVPLLAHSLFIILFYGAYFWHIQRWYFVSLFPLAVILIGTGGGRIWADLFPADAAANKNWLKLVLVGVLAILILWQAAGVWHRGVYPWQTVCLEAAEVMGPHLAGADTVGAFNAGLLGYLLPNKVVNLDGVVNGEVYHAFRQKNLTAYLHTRQVCFLADFEHVIKAFAPLGDPNEMKRWQLLQRWSSPHFPSDFVVLSVRPPSSGIGVNLRQR